MPGTQGSQVRFRVKGTHQGFWFDPPVRPGACGRQPVDVSVSHRYFSLSLSISPFHSKNKRKKYFWVRIKKKKMVASLLPKAKEQQGSFGISGTTFTIPFSFGGPCPSLHSCSLFCITGLQMPPRTRVCVPVPTATRERGGTALRRWGELLETFLAGQGSRSPKFGTPHPSPCSGGLGKAHQRQPHSTVFQESYLAVHPPLVTF